MLLSVRNQELYPRLDPSGRYILSIPDTASEPFFVVDGQHRLEALKKVMNEEADGDWSEFKIPVVIIFGADRGGDGPVS